MPPAAPEPVDTYFGACPKCRRHDGYVNIGSTHIFVCAEHRVWWAIGWNLFSSWETDTPEEKAEAVRLVESFQEVKPVYPDQDKNEGQGGRPA